MCLTTGSASRYDAETETMIPSAIGVRRLMPIECERLQGFPENWTEGLSDAARYHGLGNAVAVPCAEWVLRRLVTCHMSLLQEASQC